LWDKTKFLNIGPYEKYDFTYLKIGGLRSSAWTNYKADKYKFFGFQINVHDEVLIHRRMTYDLLNWLANIGGLQKWLTMAGVFIVG
jgi:hypothetical protein